jgi:putative thioredoxin
MTVPQFSRPGAVDLSALRKPAGTGTSAGAGAGSPGSGRYVIEVADEQSLRSDVVERSLTVVVLVSFWSATAPASVEINATLSRLADVFQGRFVLATVDVGTHPELAEALGIPQVPLVVAALRGQLAPLVQESLPEAEMRALIDQVLQAAVANGINGQAEPVGDDSGEASVDTDGTSEEPAGKYPVAEQALMSGDLDAAITAYEEALAGAPGDPEATLGLGRAKLLRRTSGVNATAARENAAQEPTSVAAQSLAADLDLMGGHVDDAFGRLIDLVRRTSGDDRDAARSHLVELFRVVGDDDPSVGRARQQLASALF